MKLSINILKKKAHILRRFGIKIFILEYLKRINTLDRTFGLSKIFEEKLLKKLEIDFSDIISKYKNMSETKEMISKRSFIWVFWWQGVGKLPELNRITTNSVCTNRCNHEVVFLTKDNINKYWNIPKNIQKGILNGNISITNLSDILRFYLLSTYGGVWIDSTVLVTRNFDEELYKYSFYTIKHEKMKETHICKGMWSSFFLASSKDGLVTSFVSECLLSYCEKYDCFVTYLLIDYLLNLGYRNIPLIKQEIKEVPVNNTAIFDLEPRLNGTTLNCTSLTYDDTYMFKLTYKNKHILTNNGNPTLYAKLCETYLWQGHFLGNTEKKDV